jgi:hypothetical protein
MSTLTVLQRWLGVIALALFTQAKFSAQAQPRLLSDEVHRLEIAINRNPDDAAARSKLLDYYYLSKSIESKRSDRSTSAAYPVIENAPEGKLAGTPQATIDPSGYYLADAQGYSLASEAWRRQAGKPDAKPAVLANAAFFFKTKDKEYTVKLLQRAVGRDPNNKETGARLGDEYALIILGVTLVNRNGYPNWTFVG